MLFGVVMKGRPGGTPGERSARRMRWQPPKGVTIVGEYWFPTDDPSIVAIVEAKDPATVEAIRLAWEDFFEVGIYPIVRAEEGLERLRQGMPARGPS